MADCLSDVLGSKIDQRVVAEFADPDRLAKLGVERFRLYAARRDVKVSTTIAERLVAAARQALPLPERRSPARSSPPIWSCWAIWMPGR